MLFKPMKVLPVRVTEAVQFGRTSFISNLGGGFDSPHTLILIDIGGPGL
jgi:hypothetical protein